MQNLQLNLLLNPHIPIVVMAVEQNVEALVAGEGRKAGDSGPLTSAVQVGKRQHILGTGAGQLHLLRADAAIHAKQIENGLVDALRRKCACALEAAFAHKHERPTQRPHIPIHPLAKLAHLVERRGHKAGVILGVAKVQIGVVPRATGRPAVRVNLGQHALQIGIARVFADDRVAVLGMRDNLFHRWRILLAVLGIGAIAAPLDMKGHKVQRRAGLASHCIYPIGAVVQKLVEVGRGFAVGRGVGSARATHAGGWAGSFYRRGRVVIQHIKFFGCAFPVVAQVRLVPQLPIPGCDFGSTVALGAVPHQCVYQIIPLAVVLGRTGPTHGAIELGRPIFLGNVVVFGVDQVLRHKPQLNKRLAAMLQNRVEHEVDDGPVIDGVAGIVLKIRIGRTPLVKTMHVAGAKQMMSPHVIRLLLQGRELAQQFLTLRHIGVVDLVVADVVPVVGQLALPLAGIDRHLYLRGFGCGHLSSPDSTSLAVGWRLRQDAAASIPPPRKQCEK